MIDRIRKWWNRNSVSDHNAARNGASMDDRVEHRLHAYFDALPPMENEEEDDRRILDAVWMQHATHSPASSPSRKETGTVTDTVRAFFLGQPDRTSTRLAWALGVSFAIVVLASTILLLNHRETVPQSPIADHEQRTPPVDTSATHDAPRPDAERPGETPQDDARTQDTHAPRVEQELSFAAIPVVFNLRGDGGESAGTAAENLPIAMQLIEAALKRHAIAYQVDGSGAIITDIMVRNAATDTQAEEPLRFLSNPTDGVVTMHPEKMLVSPTRIDAARLQALYREIRVDIEDELRF